MLNTAPTKHYINSPDTTFDHMMSDKPQNILSHQVLQTYSSDHYPLLINWSQKGVKSGIKYILTRKFKNTNWQEINSLLQNDQRLKAAILESDPDIIFSLIQEAKVDSLQYSAPIVKIQMKNKSPNFLKPEDEDDNYGA